MGRIAFRADDELERRLENILEAMKNSPKLRNIDINQSTVIKAALRYGMPLVEMLYLGKVGDEERQSTAEWLRWLYFWVLQECHDLGVDLPEPEQVVTGTDAYPDPKKTKTKKRLEVEERVSSRKRSRASELPKE